MKTLMRTIMLICILNFIITGLVLAQPSSSSSSSTETAVTSVSSTVSGDRSGFGTGGRSGFGTGDRSGFGTGDRSGSTTTSNDRNALDTAKAYDAQQLDSLLVRLGTTTATTGEAYISPVIPSGQISTEELLKINQDMNIMSQILGNNLQQPSYNVSSSVSTWMTSTRQKSIQAMYLQGYGALFMANVDFPLSAPPDSNAQKDQVTKDDTDQVWEQTRQQIYQPQTAEISRRFSTAGAGAAEVRYDAQKVENLKTTLIQSLKHASNIRALKADESVILSITGSGISTKIIAKIQMDDGKTVIYYEANGRQIERIYNKGEWPDLSLEQTAPTVLVIRAKKADIDAFAKSEINLEQFRQRVQIISYPLLGGRTNVATTGGSSSTSSTRDRTITSGTSGTTTGGRTTTGTTGTTTGGRTSTGTTGTATRGRTTAGTLGTTSTSESGTSATRETTPQPEYGM
jgi:hypothetical protein